MEKILCKAVRLTRDFVGVLKADNHKSGYVLFGFKDDPEVEQGFLTDSNRFVSSYEAYGIAEKAGQLKKSNSERLLFKNNLKNE